jgi:hypothetical protein
VAEVVKRLHYFNGQFLRDADLTTEQNYHLQLQRDHMRLLHTPGIAEGLDIAPPLANDTAVTVNAGSAFDHRGQRIVMANNKAVELQSFAPGQPVYITIAYRETQTDPTDEGGVTSNPNTRWTEDPLIETAIAAPANPNQKLVLARILRTGTVVSDVDLRERRVSGVKGGDLEVRSLTLASGAVAASGWVKAQLGASGQADVLGNLRVTGDLAVSGAIKGRIAVGSVQAGDLAANAVITANIADGTVTNAKLAINSVDGARIVDGGVGAAALADLAVTNAKLADNSVNGEKIVDGSVGTAKLADASVNNAKLAINSVDAAKIVDGSVGTAKLADGAVTLLKLAPSARPGVAGRSSNYWISSTLSNSSGTASTTAQKLADFVPFTKNAPESIIEVYMHTRASSGIFNGANGLTFQVRIDNVAAYLSNDAAIIGSNTVDFLSIFAVFPSLPAGGHIVSVWIRTDKGTSSAVVLDPNGYGGRIIVKETS